MQILTIRYNIPRAYITLGIPGGIALLFILTFFLTGIITPADSGTSFTNKAGGTNVNALKEKAREALLEQYGLTASGAKKNTTAVVAPPTGFDAVKQTIRKYVNFDEVMVAGIIIGLVPYSADITMKQIQLKKRERDFVKFLFELSELIRGGIDPLRAILLLSERDLGSITKLVQIAAKQTTLGYSFEQAMKNLDKMVGSKLIGNYTDLVVQASYSGGSVSDLIRKASEDMSVYLTLEEEKLSGLKQYQMILYASEVILMGTCIVMLQQFWPSLQNLSFTGGTGGVGFLAKSDIADVTVERDMYYLLILNGFLGGLVIGKISEGSIKHGLKHSVILVIMGFGAFALMIHPPGPDDTKITVISYDKTGLASFPMKNPIMVKVTDAAGHPKQSALVKFDIDSPGGALSPPQANADNKGIAFAKVTLGSTVGDQTVIVSVGKATTAITITATRGEGSAG
jgi:flagellar protein FlaJ